MAAHTDIDVDALRAYRRRPGMFNVFSRQRLALFRVYADSEVCAPNSLLDVDDGGVVAPARDHFLSMQRQAIAQLLERGILV